MRHLTRILVLGLGLVPQLTSPSAAQEISVEQLWEIGEPEGAPETVWMRIMDATIHQEHVYVVDVALPTVRMFTLGGEYVRELGRAGNGPSEFARPSSISVQGDSLRVYDLAQDRFTVFDKLGHHVRTRRVNGPEGSASSPSFLRVLDARDGWTVGTTGLIGRASPGKSISQHFTIAWNGERVDTVFTWDGNPLWIQLPGRDSLSMNTVDNPAPDGGAWLLGDSLLVTIDGEGSTGAIFAIGPDAFVRTRTREFPGTARAVTQRERGSAQAWFFDRFNIPSELHEQMSVQTPDIWPAWSKVLGDDDGGIWIRRGAPGQFADPPHGEHWMRWSLAEDTILSMHLPPGVEALRFRSGHLVAKRKGEFGVESVVLYRLEY